MDLFGKSLKQKFGGKNSAFWDKAQKNDQVFVSSKKDVEGL